MISFGELKQSSIVDVAGNCADNAKFASLVNEATRRLLRRGDWVGTVAPIQICVKKGCVVLPRYVQSIRKLSLCNQPLPVGNLWYRFINSSECGSGGWNAAWGHATDGPGVLHANGQACCYNDIMADGRLIRAYPTVLADIGKTITIFGVDNGNQPLRTDNGDGTWSEGWVISLNSPYGSPDASATPATPYVRRIDRVLKEKTQGQVRLYAYDPVADVLEDLAVYDPGEISPTYTRYSLHINIVNTAGQMSSSCCSTGNTTSGCCGTVHSLIALIKVRFIPVEFDSDLVMIDNVDAIKDQVQAIKLREAGDLRAATEFEIAAIRELNRELEDHYPEDTFSAVNNVFGGFTFSNRAF